MTTTCELCDVREPHIHAMDVRINGRRHGARIKGAMRIEYDTAKNPIIRMIPAQGLKENNHGKKN